MIFSAITKEVITMHPINRALDKSEPKLKCSKSCKHYRFDHLETPCVLSDVFSVKKGEECAIHTQLRTKG